MNLEPIDTSTTAGKAEVMWLAAEGRRVVFRPKGATISWHMAPAATWDWPNYNYAIISEPVGPSVVWATVIDGNVVMDVYTTEQEVDAAMNRGWKKARYIRADLAGEVGA